MIGIKQLMEIGSWHGGFKRSDGADLGFDVFGRRRWSRRRYPHLPLFSHHVDPGVVELASLHLSNDHGLPVGLSV